MIMSQYMNKQIDLSVKRADGVFRKSGGDCNKTLFGQEFLIYDV